MISKIGMRRVMVFGTFDIIHPGHEDFFRQAKVHGDELVAVVARDFNTFRIKGRYPRNDERKRLSAVKKIPGVDKAVLGHLNDPFRIISEEQPDVICLGYDQHSFEKGLEKKFPGIQIFRLKAYKPEMYKSSKLK